LEDAGCPACFQMLFGGFSPVEKSITALMAMSVFTRDLYSQSVYSATLSKRPPQSMYNNSGRLAFLEQQAGSLLEATAAS